MDRNARKYWRVKRGWDDLSADEKRAVERVLRTAWDGGAVLDIVAARGRHLRRRDSDRRTGHARRVLVGANVPWELAERVRACASDRGVSVYRFLVDLLEQTCDNGGGSNPSGR